MDCCTAINFVKHVKIVFVEVGVVCAAWMAFAGAFTTAKQQFMHPHMHCVLWQNLGEGSFDMLYKNYCWAAIPDPIWTTNVPYERKINMLSSTDNNFMIILFNFDRFRIESRFPFLNSHLHASLMIFTEPIANGKHSITVSHISTERYILTCFWV